MKEQDRNELQKRFEKETGTPVINSDGEFDIDYVAWLESHTSQLEGGIKAKAVFDTKSHQIKNTTNQQMEIYPISMDVFIHETEQLVDITIIVKGG